MYKSCNIPAFSSLDPSTARAGEGRTGTGVEGGSWGLASPRVSLSRSVSSGSG